MDNTAETTLIEQFYNAIPDKIDLLRISLELRLFT